VGLLLANDRGSKHVVVVAPMRNGPAERAGLRQGDQLLQIDGQRTEDMDSHSAGLLLRGKTGSSVNVQVRLVCLAPSFLHCNGTGHPTLPPSRKPVCRHGTNRSIDVTALMLSAGSPPHRCATWRAGAACGCVHLCAPHCAPRSLRHDHHAPSRARGAAVCPLVQARNAWHATRLHSPGHLQQHERARGQGSSSGSGESGSARLCA
jgi:PDZ domain